MLVGVAETATQLLKPWLQEDTTTVEAAGETDAQLTQAVADELGELKQTVIQSRFLCRPVTSLVRYGDSCHKQKEPRHRIDNS